MQLRFLGTGAADYLAPKICSCNNCTRIRQLGGRNYRRASSLLLNKGTLIDCGPHTLAALGDAGVGLNEIERLFLTHSHDDHMDASAILELASRRKAPLAVFGHETTLRQIPGELAAKLRMVPVELEKPAQAGSLLVEGLPANHFIEENPKEIPLHYLFTEGSRQWFYGVDGCWLLKPAWVRLRLAKLDLAVFDATLGKANCDCRIFEHNALDMIKQMVGAFREARILKENARIALTHLSLHTNPPHDLWASEVEAEGFILACDGLEIDL
jgi:phosphoribosyl 1,2-cyclic phosphate phosphodiesterase